MKVNILNIQNFTPKQYDASRNMSTPQSYIEDKEQKVYAAHLGFKGGKQLSALINDYKWFIAHDKMSAVN